MPNYYGFVGRDVIPRSHEMARDSKNVSGDRLARRSVVDGTAIAVATFSERAACLPIASPQRESDNVAQLSELFSKRPTSLWA